MHSTAITLHMDRGSITSHPPPLVHVTAASCTATRTLSSCWAPRAIHTQHQILHPSAITLHMGRGPILPPTGCSPCTVAAHLVLQSQHPKFLLSPVSHPYPTPNSAPHCHNPAHGERSHPTPNGCSPCTVAAVSRTVTRAPGAPVRRREPSIPNTKFCTPLP